MKLFEKVEYIDCPWQTLTAANWRKYPNDISTHVLSVDVLDRRIDPTTGALHTERLLCCKQAAPAFLRAVGLPIPEIAYFHEVSVLDPEKKEFTAVSVNLTMKSVMAVRETCIYRERSREEMVAFLAESAAAESAVDQQQQAAARSPSPAPSATDVAPAATYASFFSSLLSSRSTPTPPDPPPPAAAAPAPAPSPPLTPPADDVASPTKPTPPPPTTTNPLRPSTSPPHLVTQFVQRAEFSASFGIAAVAQMMEDAAAARFAANAKNGLRALESVIRRVVEEGEEVAAAAAAAATADGGEGEGAARAAE